MGAVRVTVCYGDCTNFHSPQQQACSSYSTAPPYSTVSIFSTAAIFSESSVCKLFSHCDLILTFMSVNNVKQHFVYLPSLPIGLVTNYQECSALKQHRFIILQFWRSEGLKLRASRTVFLLETLGENPFPYLFQFLRTACISWLLVPASIFKDNDTMSFSLSLSL